MRNVMVHDYVALDIDRVVEAVPTAAERFGAYIRQVAVWLDSQADDEAAEP